MPLKQRTVIDLILLLTLPLITVGALVWLQQRLVFFPPEPRETLLPLGTRDVRLYTADNVRLHGWYLPATDAGPTILHFHGNAEDVSQQTSLFTWAREHGFGLLAVDYRGYGKSGGNIPFRQAELWHDAEAAWRYLQRQHGIPSHRVFLWGRSLGGAAAVHLATRYEVGGVILQSTMASGLELAKRSFPWLPVRSLSRFPLQNEAMFKEVRSPVLVLHGRDDAVFPFAHAERLYAAANEPKRLVAFAGGHNISFLVLVEQREDVLLDFLTTS